MTSKCGTGQCTVSVYGCGYVGGWVCALMMGGCYLKIQAQVESLCWSIVGDESEDTGWGQTESLNLTSECQVSNVSEQ